jgi:serine/threonine-protein kinase
VSGTLKGKIAYLSPEQCESRGVDRRSDLFALGVVVWELLVGEYLYRRDSDFLAMTAIVEEAAPLASSRRPDVPRELDALVARLLQKDPRARFQTAGELVDALEQVAEHIGAALTPSRLARFMRESFGDRPEPWVELATAGGSPSVITVNSDLVPSPAVDDVLRAVPTLPPIETIDGDDLKQTLVLDSTGSQAAVEIPKHPTLPTTFDRPPPRRSSSARGVVVAIALIAIVGAAFGVLAMTRGGAHERAAKAPPDAAARPLAVRPVVVAAPPPSPIDAPPTPPPPAIDAPPPPIDPPPPPPIATPTSIVHPIPHRRPHERPRPSAQPGSAAEPTPDAAPDDCGGDPMACQH